MRKRNIFSSSSANPIVYIVCCRHFRSRFLAMLRFLNPRCRCATTDDIVGNTFPRSNCLSFRNYKAVMNRWNIHRQSFYSFRNTFWFILRIVLYFIFIFYKQNKTCIFAHLFVYRICIILYQKYHLKIKINFIITRYFRQKIIS